MDASGQRDVDYALDMLRYVTTERVLDSLTSGNYEERRDHLEGFWKAHDTTPETAYNEVMTEMRKVAMTSTKEGLWAARVALARKIAAAMLMPANGPTISAYDSPMWT